MLIVALSTLAKIWNESKCLSMNEWIKKYYIYIHTYIYIYIIHNGIYLAYKREENPVTYNNMD
jgi:hypothetical protein